VTPHSLGKLVEWKQAPPVATLATTVKGQNIDTTPPSQPIDLKNNVEGRLKLAQGIDPNETAEARLKRSQGIDPTLTAETRLQRSQGILALPSSATALLNPQTNQQLNQAAKTVTPDINNARYTQFVDAIKTANRGIEEKLQKIVDGLLEVARSPRQLYVSSPQPVQDASRVLSDVTRGAVLNAGLG